MFVLFLVHLIGAAYGKSIQEVRDSNLCRFQNRNTTRKDTMAPKKRGSANTKVSPSLEESSNLETLQVDQLAKMIQGYEEKNNATAEIMIKIKKNV